MLYPSLFLLPTCCTDSKVIGPGHTQVHVKGGACTCTLERKKPMHEGHVTSGRKPHIFSVRSPMWGSLLNYKRGDSGHEKGGFLFLP